MRIRKEAPVDLLFDDEDIVVAAKISDALAHPVRIRMLRFILKENLARRNVTNKDIVFAFDYAQATISQHLSKLVIGGLLDVRKKGTSSCYFARVGRLSHFAETLKKLESHSVGEMPDFLRSDSFMPEAYESKIGEGQTLDFFDEEAEEGFEGTKRYL